ncbi:MAG: hypothetical protein WA160_15925 [Pseudobdellovibrio sp.]
MKQLLNYFVLTSLISIFSLPAFSNELRMTKAQALALGFTENLKSWHSLSVTKLASHELPWPIQFVDANHTIGNSMSEYQNYGTEAYYHEGADLRISKAGEVKAPATGFLQGDYYTYVTDQNTGQDVKYTKPISAGGDDLYFELTIKTSSGLTLELHHVNAKTLPKNIYALVSSGGGPIEKGDTIGFGSLWPVSRLGARYDHIHYNIISADGVYLNPES